MRRKLPGNLSVVGLCVMLLVALSCNTEMISHSETPPVDAAQGFSQSGETPPPAEWWTAFDDDNLDALVDAAVAGNLSLRSAWDRLDQARAVARIQGAALYPTLDLTSGVSRSHTETNALGANTRNDLSLGLATAYEIDLWGRIRSSRDAAALDAQATEEDLRAAGITLSAQVADVWVTLIEQHGQIKLLNEQIKTNERYLELITLRFRRGQVPATDVLQQRQLVEAKQGEKVEAEGVSRLLEHQLAVLTGRSPGTLTVPEVDELPKLPPLPDTGVPADWIRTRPDIRAAYLDVQAADKRVAAAIADQYPRIGLSATGGTSAENVRDLFDNWFASIAASLLAPVFDGGRRSAEVDRTRAVASERFNRYGQTVLDALKEVEDALVLEAHQRKLLESLDEQLALSKKSADQTRERYARGGEDFLRVLTTVLNHQNLQRTVLRGQRLLVQHRIRLYRALGGGWNLKRPITGAHSTRGPEHDVK